MRALGVATRQRVASLPDVPTYAEQGFPNVDINGWFSVIGPAKMKPADVKRIHAAVLATFATPEAAAEALSVALKLDGDLAQKEDVRELRRRLGTP